jgi:hypothetical protein
MPAPRSPSEFLSSKQLEGIRKDIGADAKAGRGNEAWQGIQTLMPAARRQEFVALAVVYLVGQGHFSVEQSLELLADVYEAQKQSAAVLALLGSALDRARNINVLNAPPPQHPLFLNVTTALAELVGPARGTENEVDLLEGLATAARMLARQRDDLVEMSCRRLIELRPKNDTDQYNLGLFYKTRGRFREGMLANQAAQSLLLLPSPKEYDWNLGICATGAGAGAEALKAWQRLQQKIELGRFDLPEGSYPNAKVKVARRPLAERTAETDDPGREESIWVERLSPCHGIIRSVTAYDIGVDYGDVILFDGAPLIEQIYGDEKIPVFPHLATLRRNHYQHYNFAGTQQEARQIHNIELQWDAVVCSNTESFRNLCAQCWADPDIDHAHDQAVDQHVVMGQIAAPPDWDPRELLRQLDAAMARLPGCSIYVPGLCEAADQPERAAVEKRRFKMIAAN